MNFATISRTDNRCPRICRLTCTLKAEQQIMYRVVHPAPGRFLEAAYQRLCDRHQNALLSLSARKTILYNVAFNAEKVCALKNCTGLNGYPILGCSLFSLFYTSKTRLSRVTEKGLLSPYSRLNRRQRAFCKRVFIMLATDGDIPFIATNDNLLSLVIGAAGLI